MPKGWHGAVTFEDIIERYMNNQKTKFDARQTHNQNERTEEKRKYDEHNKNSNQNQPQGQLHQG